MQIFRPTLSSGRLLAPALVCAAFLAAAVFSSSPQAPQSGADSIRQSELREKIVFLASRELKGRGNGSPQLKEAADYIAQSLQRSGVKAAGDRGGFLQNFEMFIPRLGPSNAFTLDGGAMRLGSDYVPHFLSPKGDVRGSLVFLGYGVSAPHLGFDEVSRVNLRGRIAVVIDGYPRSGDENSPFAIIDTTDFATVPSKARSVYESGAAGLIVIQNPANRNWTMAQLEDTFSPQYPLREAPMGDPAEPGNPKLPVVIVPPSLGTRLVPGIAALQRSIDETLKPQSLAIDRTAALRVDVERTTFGTQNVVGTIEGSDPQVRDQVIVIGAHYDHDGESGGEIWPGADDDASGVAGMLELAEAFGNGAAPPRRTLVFCAFAGEEKGEVGSRHFVAHSAALVPRMAAMLQLDMIGRNEEHGADARLGLQRETSASNANSINVLGSIFSPDLKRQVEAANAGIGLQIRFRYDDARQNLLRRSDQWAFLQKQVPSLFFYTGEHPDYHRPTDTADKINYPKLEKIVKLVYAAVNGLAADGARPRFVVP